MTQTQAIQDAERGRWPTFAWVLVAAVLPAAIGYAAANHWRTRDYAVGAPRAVAGDGTHAPGPVGMV